MVLELLLWQLPIVVTSVVWLPRQLWGMAGVGKATWAVGGSTRVCGRPSAHFCHEVDVLLPLHF